MITVASTIVQIYHRILISHNTTKPHKIDRYLNSNSIHIKVNQLKSHKSLKIVLNWKIVPDNKSAVTTTVITALIDNPGCYLHSNTSSNLSH